MVITTQFFLLGTSKFRLATEQAGKFYTFFVKCSIDSPQATNQHNAFNHVLKN